jgi:peptide/nickel transport system permease protein
MKIDAFGLVPPPFDPHFTCPEASLSFLGFGVQEPTAAWGLMLSGNASDFYRQAPWPVLFPGVAISLAVLAFNLFGDRLRDFLDPRFKV